MSGSTQMNGVELGARSYWLAQDTRRAVAHHYSHSGWVRTGTIASGAALALFATMGVAAATSDFAAGLVIGSVAVVGMSFVVAPSKASRAGFLAGSKMMAATYLVVFAPYVTMCCYRDAEIFGGGVIDAVAGHLDPFNIVYHAWHGVMELAGCVVLLPDMVQSLLFTPALLMTALRCWDLISQKPATS